MNLTEGFTSEEKGYGADEIDYRVVDASEILSTVVLFLAPC